MDEIKNKVKDSGLIQLDLADFKPRVSVVGIDLTPQLWQGLVLKEKDIRAWIKENDWKTWCPGAQIGEIIDTPLNPVIYAR